MNPTAAAALRREDRLTALTLLAAVAFGVLMFWLVPPLPHSGPIPSLEPRADSQCPLKGRGGSQACTGNPASR